MSHLWVASPRDLDSWHLEQAARYPRGFGYWAWKPYIVQSLLGRIPEDDLVVYLDGRTFVPKTPVGWINTSLADTGVDFVAFQMDHVEREWTTGDLLGHFGCTTADGIALSGQFAGGLFAVRNNPPGRSVIDAWVQVTVGHADLCRDEPSHLPNYEGFVENRHDQSVLSLLLKTSENVGLDLVTLSPEVVYSGQSLRPHGKGHPKRMFR